MGTAERTGVLPMGQRDRAVPDGGDPAAVRRTGESAVERIVIRRERMAEHPKLEEQAYSAAQG